MTQSEGIFDADYESENRLTLRPLVSELRAFNGFLMGPLLGPFKTPYLSHMGSDLENLYGFLGCRTRAFTGENLGKFGHLGKFSDARAEFLGPCLGVF